MPGEIINKVAASGLITLDLEDYLPSEQPIAFDLKIYLFKELILKEKDFRQALKAVDWTTYQDKSVALFCSNDAIIPRWAFMLVGSYLQNVAAYYGYGSTEQIEQEILRRNLQSIDLDSLKDKRVIIKGCGQVDVSAFAYVEITRLLQPIALSLMYGEACSNVPVYKRKKS